MLYQDKEQTRKETKMKCKRKIWTENIFFHHKNLTKRPRQKKKSAGSKAKLFNGPHFFLVATRQWCDFNVKIWSGFTNEIDFFCETKCSWFSIYRLFFVAFIYLLHFLFHCSACFSSDHGCVHRIEWPAAMNQQNKNPVRIDDASWHW